MIDVFAALPGASPKETENLLARPIEQRMRELPGVDHVYSVSGDGYAMITVRFNVGEDQERSVTKVHAKLAGAMDAAPAGALPPLVKPHSIDDVPVLALTLHGAGTTRMRCVSSRCIWRTRFVPCRTSPRRSWSGGRRSSSR